METNLELTRPTFTTCPPGISSELSAKADEFARRFETSRKVIFKRQEVTSFIRKGSSFFEKKRMKPLALHIHGVLEDIVGYDIPLFLAGYIYNKPIQWAHVFDPTGRRRFDAAIVMEERKTRYYGILVFQHEARDYLPQLRDIDFGS